VLPLFVRGILFWLAEHFEARRPGLVAGRMLSTGEMAVSPFDRVRSALAVYRACCKAPEDREDAQKLEHFHGIVYSNAVLTGRAPVPDLERARTVLSHHGIEMRGDGDPIGRTSRAPSPSTPSRIWCWWPSRYCCLG
jgi:hypothetical protein